MVPVHLCTDRQLPCSNSPGYAQEDAHAVLLDHFRHVHVSAVLLNVPATCQVIRRCWSPGCSRTGEYWQLPCGPSGDRLQHSKGTLISFRPRRLSFYSLSSLAFSLAKPEPHLSYKRISGPCCLEPSLPSGAHAAAPIPDAVAMVTVWFSMFFPLLKLSRHGGMQKRGAGVKLLPDF